MGVLKAKVDGSWVEVGGAGGVPAGGTTGQVLTKTSAADYATAWGTNQPILSNNSFLQGYKADGTTVQALIGMNPSNHMMLGPSLISPQQIGIVNNVFFSAALSSGTLQHIASVGPTDIVYLAYGPLAAGLSIGAGALGDINIGLGMAGGKKVIAPALEVVGAITKGGVSYVHPDYILESWATGRIEKFREAPGARDYGGLRPLAEAEAYIREHWRLPDHVRHDMYDVFRRGDELLASLEEAFLYLIDHEHRLTALEGRG